MRIGILIPTRGIIMQSARRPPVDECWTMARHADAAGWLPVYWNLGDEPLGDDLVRCAENAEAYRKAFPKGPPYFTAASSFQGTNAKDPHFRLSDVYYGVYDRLTAEEGHSAQRLYLLVTGALRALAEGQRDASLVLDAFLLRAMVFAGWAPAITECARCGLPGRVPTVARASASVTRCGRTS